MSEEHNKVELEIAIKGLEFARGKAHEWQTKLLLLQTFGVALVGIAKVVHRETGARAGTPTAETSGAKTATTLIELIPTIVIVTFAVAALILFLANGHLRVANYWSKEIDRRAGTKIMEGYLETLSSYYRYGWGKLLGILPALVISFVLFGAAALASGEFQTTRNQVLSWTLLGLAFGSFVGTLVQSARSQDGPRRS